MSGSPYCPTTAPLDKDEVVASYIENRPGQNERDHGVATFVIDESSKNTAQNPSKEATITVPFLVKKTRSKDLVPRPWKSLKQLIIVSYVSFLCCFLTGACANHYAWEAHRMRELGLLSEAKHISHVAAKCVYLSFAIGLILCVVIPLALVCGVYNMC